MLVGKGSYSSVYYKKGEAFKVTAHSEYDTNSLIPVLSLDYSAVREVFIYAQLHHPHRFFATPKGFYLVQPYIPFTLARWARKCKTYTQTDIHRLMCDVLYDLHCLHEQGIVHQDLKPHNIMMDEEQRAYLIDYGSAMGVRDTTDDAATETIQTLSYRAPEELTTTPVSQRPKRGGSFDIWSLGIVWIEALLGLLNRPLFWKPEWAEEQEATLLPVLLRRITLVVPCITPWLKEQGVDSHIISLLEQMISFNPQKRPTTAQLLSHPVLQPYRRFTGRRCREIIDPTLYLVDKGLTSQSLQRYQEHTEMIWNQYASFLQQSTIYKVLLALIYLHRFYEDPLLLHELPVVVHIAYIIQEDISQPVTEYTGPLLSISYKKVTPLVRRLVQARCPLLSPVPWIDTVPRPEIHQIRAYLKHLASQPTLDTSGLYSHYRSLPSK